MNTPAERLIPNPAALWVLRLGIALTCIGVAAQMLMYGGPVLSWLWMDLGMSEDIALSMEHSAAYGLIAAIPFLFVPRAWPAHKAVGFWLMFTMVCATLIGTWHPWLTPGAHAARYLAPIALIGLYTQTRRGLRWADWLLRAGIAATFICHGIEAMLAKPQFLDYLIRAFDRIGTDLSEDTARQVLLVIGVVDVVVGVAILVPRRWRIVALWLGFWGLLTAFARMVYAGLDNWPETLMRVTNGAVPFTLFFLWARRRDETVE